MNVATTAMARATIAVLLLSARVAAQGHTWLAFAEGQHDDALGIMRQAVAREDATEKSAVTPGPLAPARELLADMLLESKRPRDALTEYRRVLEKEPKRLHALNGVKRSQARP